MHAKRPLRNRLRPLVAWAIPLCLAGTAEATTPKLTAIDYAAVVSGRLVFVHPDGALMVLDARTGKTVFRGQPRPDETYGWGSFLDTPHGLVVRTYRQKGGRRYDNVYRMLDLKTLASVWEVVSTPACHVGEDYLICPDEQRHLSTRQLRDGKVLWSYQPESGVGEVLDSKGRVVVAGQDEDRRIRDRADGSKLLSSRHRVRSISLLDGRTGKEILGLRGLAIDVADVAYGMRPITFDGRRLVINVRPADGSCATRLVRVFTVNAASTAFVSEEKCQPVPPAPPAHADFQRFGRKLSPDHLVAVGEGRVFVERTTPSIGTLDCLDASSGRLLWQYTFSKPDAAWSGSRF